AGRGAQQRVAEEGQDRVLLRSRLEHLTQASPCQLEQQLGEELDQELEQELRQQLEEYLHRVSRQPRQATSALRPSSLECSPRGEHQHRPGDEEREPDNADDGEVTPIAPRL